jgi:hypothetical protein
MYSVHAWTFRNQGLVGLFDEFHMLKNISPSSSFEEKFHFSNFFSKTSFYHTLKIVQMDVPYT